MATDKGAREGTKVSQAEATKDPEQLLQLTKDQAETADVEGQAPYSAYVWCPGCRTKYRTVLSTRVYKYYSCPRCGTYFKA